MLKIRNIHFSYSEKKVLKGLNLEAHPGEIHGILGMNGSGKTTLFKTIYGFNIPESGECVFNNQSVIKRDIAYLETNNFFYSYMKGREYLELCALQNPEFNIENWNQLFQLPLNDMVETYSTGMKKKLAFMGIAALDRPILILDEPFNGVDFESSETLYEILKRFRKQGKIILLSSHIIESLTNICDEVSYLSEGVIERKYSAGEFGQMETELRDVIREKVTEALDNIFEPDLNKN